MGEEKEKAKTITRKGDVEYRVLIAEGRFIAYAYEKPNGKRENKISIALSTGEKLMLILLKTGNLLAIPDTFDTLTVYDEIKGRSKTFTRENQTSILSFLTKKDTA